MSATVRRRVHSAAAVSQPCLARTHARTHTHITEQVNLAGEPVGYTHSLDSTGRGRVIENVFCFLYKNTLRSHWRYYYVRVYWDASAFLFPLRPAPDENVIIPERVVCTRHRNRKKKKKSARGGTTLPGFVVIATPVDRWRWQTRTGVGRNVFYIKLCLFDESALLLTRRETRDDDNNHHHHHL